MRFKALISWAIGLVGSLTFLVAGASAHGVGQKSVLAAPTQIVSVQATDIFRQQDRSLLLGQTLTASNVSLAIALEAEFVQDAAEPADDLLARAKKKTCKKKSGGGGSSKKKKKKKKKASPSKTKKKK